MSAVCEKTIINLPKYQCESWIISIASDPILQEFFDLNKNLNENRIV